MAYVTNGLNSILAGEKREEKPKKLTRPSFGIHFYTEVILKISCLLGMSGMLLENFKHRRNVEVI